LKPNGDILEWCSSPGFIGFDVLSKYEINSLTLSDNNTKLSRLINKTIRINRLKNVFFICSEFKNLPPQKFDLIIANPPHYGHLGDYPVIKKNRSRVIDPNWQAHKEFLMNVYGYMNPNSVLILQFNSEGSSSSDFKNFIDIGNLYITHIVTYLDLNSSYKNFYYLVLKKVK
jgi:methylase of polypeptide subunit release factors